MKTAVVILLSLLFFVKAQPQYNLNVLGHLPYKSNEYSWTGCDLETEPCADLNDIWSFTFEENGVQHYFAIVGLSNGIDIVDVTDPTNPSRVKFIHGCNNIWRDMKVWENKIYAISEYTATCACDTVHGRCLEQLEVLEPPSLVGLYKMTEGRISPQLNTTGPVVHPVVAVEPWDDKACNFIENKLNGSIALIPRGDCSYSMKFLMAQAAGALGVIIVNEEDSIIYPGMAGEPNGINIPGVMIGKSDGAALKAQLDNNITVRVNMSAEKYYSNYFTVPEGLTIIDMTDPWNPSDPLRWTKHFDFAHNLGLEFEFGRPYMYVVGMSDRNGKQDGFADISNGGVFAYDVSNQTAGAEPNLVWIFNETYIHDTSVQICQDSYILVGAAIYDDLVFMWNVTNINNVTKLGSFPARHGWAHNVYLDKDCTTLYVTHEEYNEPISTWQLFQDENGKTLWNVHPKYIGSLAVNQFDGTLPHNVYVNDTRLYAAYYSMGVLVWDITNATRPQLMAHKDTNTNFTSGFHGVWGVYPHHPDGVIYASDIEAGLFLLRLDVVPVTESATDVTVIVLSSFLGLAILVISVLAFMVWKSRQSSYASIPQQH